MLSTNNKDSNERPCMHYLIIQTYTLECIALSTASDSSMLFHKIIGSIPWLSSQGLCQLFALPSLVTQNSQSRALRLRRRPLKWQLWQQVAVMIWRWCAAHFSRRHILLTSTRVCMLILIWEKANSVEIVLKQVHPDMGISNKAMAILNSFPSCEIQIALRLFFPVNCWSMLSLRVSYYDQIRSKVMVRTMVFPIAILNSFLNKILEHIHRLRTSGFWSQAIIKFAPYYLPPAKGKTPLLTHVFPFSCK